MESPKADITGVTGGGQPVRGVLSSGDGDWKVFDSDQL